MNDAPYAARYHVGVEAARQHRPVRSRAVCVEGTDGDVPSTTTMPWGKHRGIALGEIETSYLVWVLEKTKQLGPSLRTAIAAELAFRFGSTPPRSSWRAACPDPALAARIVSTGLHVLARKHHPDVGGDTRMMQSLNATADWLKSQVPQ